LTIISSDEDFPFEFTAGPTFTTCDDSSCLNTTKKGTSIFDSS